MFGAKRSCLQCSGGLIGLQLQIIVAAVISFLNSRGCSIRPSLAQVRVVRFVRDYMNSIPMPMQQFLADPLHHLFT